MATEKVLDKLSKLKRMAEGAKAIGSEKEAQAFAEMLQKLLLDHKLEMTDLEFEQMEAEQPIEQHMVYPQKHGLKFKRSRIEWQETLANVVAHAHFCRILVHPGTNFITLVGRREDIAVAEYLYVTLARAVEKIATLELWRYRYEQLHVTGKRGGEACYGFKASFINAFIARLQQRLKELRDQRAGDGSMALMRLNKSDKAVIDYMKELKTKPAAGLSRETSFHAEGVRRGRAAADRVNLSPNAIDNSSRKALK